MTSDRRSRCVAAFAVVTLVVLGGCGTADGGDGGAGEHDDADVTFATMMIPHHRQAITMSRLAASHAGSLQVKELASQIDAEQVPEIVQLQTMLSTWGDDVPPSASPSEQGDHGGGMPGMDGAGVDTAAMGDMPGMATDVQLAELARENGPAFDREFLELMIRHHQGAVTMAKTELADGRDPDALTMAGNISDAQEAAIALMQRLQSP